MLDPHGKNGLPASAADGNGGHHADAEAALLPLLLEEATRPRLGIRRTRGQRGLEAPLAMLARELARSRRYRRPLAVIGISPNGGVRHRPAEAAAAIRALVRAVDTVWASAESVFVLLPESDRRDGEGLLGRLREQAEALDGARATIAVFPTDGLTGGALLEIANGRMVPGVVEPPQSSRDARGLKPVNRAPAASADPAA